MFYAKWPIYLSDLNKFRVFWQVFTVLHINFNSNPST